MRPHARVSDRKGYALLLVLATLTIASVGLVTIANQTLRNNTQSLALQADLQTKWGGISCAAVALEMAGPVFEALEANNPPGQPIPTQLRERLMLGNQVFDLMLGDEDAKVNLHSVATIAGMDTAQNTVKDLIDARYWNCTRQTPQNAANSSKLENWGEWFDLASLRRMAGDDRTLAELTNNLTLWGQGRLNIHRASDQAIRAQCAAIVPVGLSNRILETMRESKTSSEVDILLQRTVQNSQDRERLAQVLGDGSTSFSLWIEVTQRVDAQQRTDATPTLTEAMGTTGPRTQRCYIRTQNPQGQIETMQFSLD